MPTPDNTVTLLINGKTHGQWTNYDIVSDLLTPADDFSVTLGRPVDAKPDAVRAGDKVEVRVGGDTVLSGRIDRVQTVTEKGGKPPPQAGSRPTARPYPAAPMPPCLPPSVRHMAQATDAARLTCPICAANLCAVGMMDAASTEAVYSVRHNRTNSRRIHMGAYHNVLGTTTEGVHHRGSRLTVSAKQNPLAAAKPARATLRCLPVSRFKTA